MVKVLIVGAGPTGLTLASELISRGIPVTLIDKAEGPSVHSKALAIQTRTLEIFEKMGIIEHFLDKGMIAKSLFFIQDGKKLEIPIVGIDSFYPFALILPQAETEHILLDHLHALNGDVHWKCEFLGFKDKCAMLHTENGTQTQEFDYVIGCDGAHSNVRHSLDIPFVGDKLKESFHLIDAQLAHPITEKGPHVIFDKHGISLMVPFKEEKMCRLILPLDQGGYEERLSQFSVTSTLWSSTFTIQRRLVETFRKNFVFLAGDAAHVHSPAGGQGMNISIQDAYNLGWKLALVINNQASDSILNSYESERKPVAQKVLKATTIVTHLVSLFHIARNSLLFEMMTWFFKYKKVLHRIAKGISQTNVNYRKSPIVSGQKAGIRAPDTLMENGKRLFEHIRSNKHVLLIFDKEAIPSTDIYDVFVISDQRVKEKYKATEGTMVMIRPDGYIGMRSQKFSEKKIATYLQKIGL